MSIKYTVSKIAKGAGAKGKIIEQNVRKSANNLKKTKAGRFIKSASSKILEDVPEKAKYDSMTYQLFDKPKRIKTKYAVGGVAAIAGLTATGSLIDRSYRMDLGKIESGGLSHMTSQIVSPLTQELQNGNYESENIMHNTNSLPLRDSGAEGDIVFALHNMR